MESKKKQKKNTTLWVEAIHGSKFVEIGCINKELQKIVTLIEEGKRPRSVIVNLIKFLSSITTPKEETRRFYLFKVKQLKTPYAGLSMEIKTFAPDLKGALRNIGSKIQNLEGNDEKQVVEITMIKNKFAGGIDK